MLNKQKFEGILFFADANEQDCEMVEFQKKSPVMIIPSVLSMGSSGLSP
jgi:hypothetical protein